MNKNNPDAPPVYGNYEDKYHSSNWIARAMVNNFFSALKKNLARLQNTPIASICEVGCGEGELLKVLHLAFPAAELYATDLSEEEVEKARQNNSTAAIHFTVQNAQDLTLYENNAFDLVVCSEVLEHLTDPQRGLAELCRISRAYLLVSVPNEPIWRFLNMGRGKYLQDFGNTPGHLNHWTPRQFLKILKTQPNFTLESASYPFPWQMMLLQKRDPAPQR